MKKFFYCLIVVLIVLAAFFYNPSKFGQIVFADSYKEDDTLEDEKENFSKLSNTKSSNVSSSSSGLIPVNDINYFGVFDNLPAYLYKLEGLDSNNSVIHTYYFVSNSPNLILSYFGLNSAGNRSLIIFDNNYNTGSAEQAFFLYRSREDAISNAFLPIVARHQTTVCSVPGESDAWSNRNTGCIYDNSSASVSYGSAGFFVIDNELGSTPYNNNPNIFGGALYIYGVSTSNINWGSTPVYSSCRLSSLGAVNPAAFNSDIFYLFCPFILLIFFLCFSLFSLKR